ncbi:MAG: DUF3347 domain-containing protein [Cytophagales bacterium]|nr:DUF3347 domain-containing protein [Cytophagales bacterium]MDW8383379.1 DUF3347 domain-containing protein [Flammeovirgaceae bacterium]
MKITLSIIALLLVSNLQNFAQNQLFEKVAPAVRKKMNYALYKYYDVKDAFVESNSSKIVAKAELFSKALQEIPTDIMETEQKEYFMAQKAIIDSHIVFLLRTTFIREQREHFNQISLAFYKIVKSFKANQFEAYLQYCWMAREGDTQDAYWISSEKKIVNPYLPETMLHCGKIADSF